MTGCPELSVSSCGSDLSEHVLVEVPLGIPILHGDMVDHIDDLGQEGGLRNSEAGILHVMRIGGVISTEVAKEEEDMLSDYIKHLGGSEVLETGPAEILVRATLGILPLGENPALDLLIQPSRFALFQSLDVIEPL